MFAGAVRRQRKEDDVGEDYKRGGMSRIGGRRTATPGASFGQAARKVGSEVDDTDSEDDEDDDSR